MTPAQRAKALRTYICNPLQRGKDRYVFLESEQIDLIREALEQMAAEGTVRTEKPCRYYKAYKAIYKPKCNCQPCMDKWIAAQDSRSEGGGE